MDSLSLYFLDNQETCHKYYFIKFNELCFLEIDTLENNSAIAETKIIIFMLC